MDPRNSIVPAVQQINTNLNVPGGGGFRTAAKKAAPRGLVGTLDAGMQIQQGENPIRAFGRAGFGMLSGSVGAGGALFVGGEGTPFDMLTAGAGYNEGYKAGTGLFNRLFGKPTKNKPPEPPRGRVETKKTNANNVEQIGTQMSVSNANDLLGDGYEIQNPFASTQLPSTAYSPYAGQGLSEIYNPQTLHQFNSDVNNIQLAEDLFGGKSGVKAVTPTNQISAMDVYGEEANRINQLKAQGAPFLVRNGEIPTTSAVDPANSGTNWAARTAADNSDPKLARRRAFLNPDRNAFEALRDVEALQGLSYASGQHYMHNPIPNEDGKYTMTAITGKDRQDDVRGYKSGRLSANDLKDKYMGAITASKYSPTNADNIVDTLTMPGNYMTGATPSKSITDYTNMMDTDIDYEAMGKRNPGGMIGGITYKR